MVKKLRYNNFKKAWKILVTLVLFSISIALTSCSEEGPIEKAGKKLDKAAEEVGDKIEDAGDKIEDAVEK
jgi:predicted small secreted protein